jgi:hypothetical protein
MEFSRLREVYRKTIHPLSIGKVERLVSYEVVDHLNYERTAGKRKKKLSRRSQKS